MGDASSGDHAVERTAALLRHGRDHGGSTLRGGQVGHHLGVAHVDAEDGVVSVLQASAQRAPDAAGGSGDGDRAHQDLSSFVMHASSYGSSHLACRAVAD